MKNPSLVDRNEPDRGPSNDGYLTKLYREAKRPGRDELPPEAAIPPAPLARPIFKAGPVLAASEPSKTRRFVESTVLPRPQIPARSPKKPSAWTVGRRAALLLSAWALVGGTRQARGAAVVVPQIEAAPGSVIRWSLPGTKRCAMGRKAWPALQETCYYPIDLSEKQGVITISRRGVGPAELAHISVGVAAYGTEDITLGDIPQANPKPADLQRNARDQALLAKVWARQEGPARFTLPLGAPASSLPDGKGFGSKWIFNGKVETADLHTGADYALTVGTPILAVADGTVVVAQDLFFPGNAVFVDHGDGLISMYFHFSEIKVKSGQEVKRGEILGLVGETGRASGPHLHIGIRWHSARIDPRFLLGDPAKIPAVVP